MFWSSILERGAIAFAIDIGISAVFTFLLLLLVPEEKFHWLDSHASQILLILFFIAISYEIWFFLANWAVALAYIIYIKYRNDNSSHPNSNDDPDDFPHIEEDFESRVGGIKPDSYDPLHIGDVLNTSDTRDMYSTLNWSQINVVKAPLPYCETQEDLAQLMETWFEIFDKAFFFRGLGKVGVHVETRALTEEENSGRARLEGNPDLVGVFAYIPAMKPTFPGIHYIAMNALPRKIIEAYPYQPKDQRHRSSYEETYVSYLLHEMTHAFITMYSCKCRHCRVVKEDISYGGTGPEGHGPLWANSMIGLQTALQEQVKWKVGCGILGGVVSAIDAHEGKWIPATYMLASWGLENSELAKTLYPNVFGQTESAPKPAVEGVGGAI